MKDLSIQCGIPVRVKEEKTNTPCIVRGPYFYINLLSLVDPRLLFVALSWRYFRCFVSVFFHWLTSDRSDGGENHRNRQKNQKNLSHIVAVSEQPVLMFDFRLNPSAFLPPLKLFKGNLLKKSCFFFLSNDQTCMLIPSDFTVPLVFILNERSL